MINKNYEKIKSISQEIEATYKKQNFLANSKRILIQNIIRKRFSEVIAPYTWQVSSFYQDLLENNQSFLRNNSYDENIFGPNKIVLKLKIKNSQDNDSFAAAAAAHITTPAKYRKKKSFASKSMLRKNQGLSEDDLLKKLFDTTKTLSYEELTVLAERLDLPVIKLNKDIMLSLEYNQVCFGVNNNKADELFEYLKNSNISISLSSLISEIECIESDLSYRKRIISDLSKNILFGL